jgi:hypothetical protein
MFIEETEDYRVLCAPNFTGFNTDGNVGLSFNFSLFAKEAKAVDDLNKAQLVAVLGCFGPNGEELNAIENLMILSVSGENQISMEGDPTGEILSSIGTLSTVFTWSTPVSPVSLAFSFIGGLLSRNRSDKVLQGSFSRQGNSSKEVIVGRYLRRGNADVQQPIIGEHAFSVLIKPSSAVSTIALKRLEVLDDDDSENEDLVVSFLRADFPKWSLEEWSKISSDLLPNGKLSEGGAIYICAAGSYASKHPDRGNAHPLPADEGFIVGEIKERVTALPGKSWETKLRYKPGHYTLFLAGLDGTTRAEILEV